MNVIFHITSRSSWDAAKARGRYAGDTLETEGFIHCSREEQVLSVANRIFKSRAGLVLLSINRDAVKARVKDENLEGGHELFPHIYGPLNTDAVLEAIDFPPRPDGTFDLPESQKDRQNSGKGEARSSSIDNRASDG